ncbi:hypothetical protein L1887_11177 [Cichorium endivia]|nr:hypothetical protein L1887_11177 [Cichorium endivia]
MHFSFTIMVFEFAGADINDGIDNVEYTPENDDSSSRVEGFEYGRHVVGDKDEVADLRQPKSFEGVIGPRDNSGLGSGVNGLSSVGPNPSFNDGIPNLNVQIGPNMDKSTDSLKIDEIETSSDGFSMRKKKILLVEGISPLDSSKSKSGDNMDSVSLNSTDKEVENTVELGDKIGYCLKDSRASLKSIIEGEGDADIIQ